jgi:dipeptide/tripeptide permease
VLTGHPKGLYRLFFIEMWERLAFYTMVGVLLLYTIDNEKGGLGLPSAVGNEIYGLYLAFVYFTPYLGGMIADRFLGYRRSVLIGGIFFATGFFLMGTYGQVPFISGLVCLCIGNGFFKPNISVMVGNLYKQGDPKRDSGFNIFYMGINIGAFIAPFLATYFENHVGWLAIFQAAGVGMLVGITILLLSWKQLANADRMPERGPDDTPFSEVMKKILGPALVAGVAGYFFAIYVLEPMIPGVTNLVRPAICGFLAGMVPIVLFFLRLAGTANEEEKPGLTALLTVYLAGATFFMVLHLNGSAMTTWAKDYTNRDLGLTAFGSDYLEDALPGYYRNAPPDRLRPNPLTVLEVEPPEAASMFGQKRMSEEILAALTAAHAGEIQVITVDENTDPGIRKRAADIFSTVEVSKSPDAHGVMSISVSVEEGAEPTKTVAFVRQVGDQQFPVFLVDADTHHYLYDGFREKHGREPEVLPPGEYQELSNTVLSQIINPGFVILLTPLIVAFFAWRINKGKPFSTARKLFLGMVLTSLALVIMACAGFLTENGAIKASVLWLVAFYLIITTGELCLSPMALSLVTKLSPKRLVGLTMGGWFLATAFGNNFSGFFGGLQSHMDPAWFFLLLAGLVGLVALFVFVKLPKLDEAIQKYGG